MSSSHETFVKENRSFWGEGDVVELVPTVFWVKGKKKKKNRDEFRLYHEITTKNPASDKKKKK